MESVFLTKEMLLDVQDELAIEKVDLKTSKGVLRGHVYVREMTAKEKDTWEGSLRKEMPAIGGQKGGQQTEIKMNLADYRTKLAICTLCDANGERIFDMLPKTIAALGKQLSATNMEAIADTANRLNKITEEDQDALVKN